MTRALLTLGHSTASREQLLDGAGVEELVDEVLAARGPTAALCSEAMWWRCHRRMIADFVVLARGVPVRHLMHDGRSTTTA